MFTFKTKFFSQVAIVTMIALWKHVDHVVCALHAQYELRTRRNSGFLECSDLNNGAFKSGPDKATEGIRHNSNGLERDRVKTDQTG